MDKPYLESPGKRRSATAAQTVTAICATKAQPDVTEKLHRARDAMVYFTGTDCGELSALLLVTVMVAE